MGLITHGQVGVDELSLRVVIKMITQNINPIKI